MDLLAVLTYIGQLVQESRVSITLSSPAVQSQRAGAVDHRSHWHLDRHQLPGGYTLWGAARLDSRIAPRFADSHGDVLPSNSVFLLATVMLLSLPATSAGFPCSCLQSEPPPWLELGLRPVCCVTASYR